MRQIATLTDPAQADLLADHLFTLRIETRLDRGADGVAVWVCDEDRVAQARQELADFLRDPAGDRYAAAPRAASQMRRQEEADEESYRAKQASAVQARDAVLKDEAAPDAPGKPLTVALVAVSIAVGLATSLGKPDEGARRLMAALQIAPPGHLALGEVAAGEVWRLVTPIFLHFGVVHLLFNMLMLNDLGGLVESKRGSGRFLLLVLGFAVVSNVAQFYLGRPMWEPGLGLILYVSGAFGGMSGVLYGLFGYAWMKTRFEPDLGVVLAPGTVAFLLGWFLLCLTPAVENVANAAHAAGLIAGVVVGAAPAAWRAVSGR